MDLSVDLFPAPDSEVVDDSLSDLPNHKVDKVGLDIGVDSTSVCDI